MGPLGRYARGLHHVAVAVRDLEKAIAWYRDVLGFELVERRMTEGERTAMISAVLAAGPITVVLIQGTAPESQVSRYVDAYGPGVQHIAIEVTDLAAARRALEDRGTPFVTSIIEGDGIRQAFTRREPNSGMMYELIEQYHNDGCFTDRTVHQLFHELEEKDVF